MQDFDKMCRDLEDAQKDAFSYGAGWLMVDQKGHVRRVSPPEIRAWMDYVEKPDRGGINGN